MMRIRGDVDQKRLAELFYEYLNVEEDFIRELFARGDTQLGRMFVQERVLPPEISLRVLDHERASAAVREAEHLAVGVCYCRHKMEHVGRACQASREICLTLGNTARSLAKHGFARAIDAAEGLDLLAKAQDEGLAQFGENVREHPAFICNCCGCCCEAMIAARRFGFLQPVHTTSYIAVIDDETCDGCARCARACPVDAIEMIPDDRPESATGKRARRDEERCLGCGVCIGTCTREALVMEERAERVFTPVNSVHRTVLMAIERGTLQGLVFDNQAHLSHRAMAAVLGAIFKLSPAKRALASEHALGNATRRRILDLVKADPGCSVGTLAARFDTTRIAVMHHLRQLEACELLLSHKERRHRRLYFNAVPIQEIHDRWTSEFSALWASRITRVKYRVESQGKRKRNSHD